jgi:hypothetical protein
MVCILVNCLFLALDDPTATTEAAYQVLAGTVFLFIFTLELTFKLTALGKIYFSDYWNWLDMVSL